MTFAKDLIRPMFAINLAVAAPVWTPAAWQVRRFTNPNYLNSLWLGVWSVIAAPGRFLQWVPKMLDGHVLMCLYMMLIGVWAVAFRHLCWGIAGRARGVNLPMATLVRSRVMAEQEAADWLRAGRFDLIHTLNN